MKLSLKVITIIIAALVFCLNALAEVNLPTVDLLGENYYVYTVKKGDSMFSIARANGWDYDKLMELNPKAISPLAKGLKVYYPVNTNSKSDKSPKTTQTETQTTPLTHKIKKGETVYAISRMYGIPVETIFKLNPGSQNGIREGATLNLGETNNQGLDENPEYYVIKRGDTLYGVARANQTTVAEILKKNPGVSEKNFQAGATIRLPKKGEGVTSSVQTVEHEQLNSFSTYKVEKNDTWDTIADKTGVDKDDLIKANKDAGEKPKNKSLIAVPNIETTTVEQTVVVEDPRELTQEGINEIYEDVHGIADADETEGLKVTILLSEPNSKKDLEYMRGFMTALRNLKDSGDKIKLDVINSNKPSTDLLTELSDINSDIIFYTSEKGIPDYLAEFAEISQTPLVNIFDVKNELYTNNPYILHLLTPSNYFNDEIVAKLASDYNGAKLINVGADDSDQMGSLLKDLWSGNVANLTNLQMANYGFNNTDRYLIYAYPTKKEEVAELLNAVKEAKSNNLTADITVIGRPGWIVFDEPAMEERYYDCNVMIPSRFYYDKNSSKARMFEMHYKSLFDRQPTKSFPMYAVMGYDTASYFIPALLNANRDMNALTESRNGVQSDFSLRRPSNWSGIVNTLVYLVRFTPYNTIDKIKVK